jgi:hypothetical protein
MWDSPKTDIMIESRYGENDGINGIIGNKIANQAFIQCEILLKGGFLL